MAMAAAAEPKPPSLVNRITVCLSILVVFVAIGFKLAGRESRKATQSVLPPDRSSRVQAEAPSVGQTREPRQLDRIGSEPPAGDTTDMLFREEVENYVNLHQRDATSLLAAFHALKDTNYQHEAALNFPSDSRVQLSVLATTELSAEDRRQWLDRFKNSSPENSLADYLSAGDHLKNGQADVAVAELLEASRKTAFQTFAMDSKLDEEEINIASGRSPRQAVFSSSGWAEELLPELASLKGLAREVAVLQKQYGDAGDSASAQNLTQISLILADRFKTGDGGQFMISQLVGQAIERMALGQLDPNTSYDFLDNQTPADRLEELKARKASISELRTSAAILPSLSEAELLSYTERQRVYGEVEALRWLRQRNMGGGAP
jgi:hypothetical protein